MAHLYRFFAHRVSEGLWRLDEDEVTHALKVLRLRDGDFVEVMDGEGWVGAGKLAIESKSKASVIEVVENFTAKDPVTRSVLLGALKPGDVDELIAPLIELGIDKIVVFRQEDTPHFRISDSSAERWQRLVRSALKQSKRPWLVTVEALDQISDAFQGVANYSHKWMLTPNSSQDLWSISTDLKGVVSLVALIGGEKGLTSKEESLAQNHGFVPVRLGPWVLRARTAAPAAAVFLGMLPRLK